MVSEIDTARATQEGINTEWLLEMVGDELPPTTWAAMNAQTQASLNDLLGHLSQELYNLVKQKDSLPAVAGDLNAMALAEQA